MENNLVKQLEDLFKKVVRLNLTETYFQHFLQKLAL